MPMENIDTLLRLIRIDWEITQSQLFNPLPLALQLTNENNDNFKNTYHKIERAMMQIIEASFKGFSDSILSYKKCTENVEDNLSKLLEMNLVIDEVKKSTQIETNVLSKQKKKIENQEILLNNLKKLIELRNAIRERNIDNVEDGALNIIKCLSLYKEYSELKPVRLVQYDIERKKTELIDKISKNVISFVCETKGGVLFDVKSICILELYGLLDKSLLMPAKTSLINTIQNRLDDINRLEKDEEDALKGLATHLNSYFKLVINKYDDMIKRIKMYKKKSNNFYEKDYVPTGFFKRMIFLGLIKKEIFKLIGNFNVHAKEHTFEKFSLDEIEESENVTKLIDKKVNIQISTQSNRDAEAKKGGYEITIDIGFDFIFYLYEGIYEEAKPDLYKFLKNNYFTKKEKKIDDKLVSVFESKFMKVENKKSALMSHIRFIIEENDYYGLDFGLSNFITIFIAILKGFNNNFKNLYKCKVFNWLFNDIKMDSNDENLAKCLNILKLYIKDNVIEPGDCFKSTKNREVSFYLLETIQETQSLFMKTRIKYESVSINPKLAGIESSLKLLYFKYKISFSYQLIIDLLFLFDHFYCEGNFGNKSSFFKEIINTIQRLYNMTQTNDTDFSVLFETFEYYIFNNIPKHNVNSIEDLQLFIEDLKTIEEVVFNFKMRYESGFDNVLEFYDSVLENVIDTDIKRELADKIKSK